MKQLLFLFTLIAVVSCTGNELDKVSELSGTLQNPGESTLIFLEGRDADTVSVNEDGSFTYVKELERPGRFSLMAGKKRVSLYLAPGYDLSVSFDLEDFDGSLVYEGDLALENNYLIQIADLNKEISGNMKELYSAPADEFLEGIKSVLNSKEKFLESYKEENPDICKEFVANEMMTYKFSYYSSLNTYEPAHKYYAKVEEVQLPEGWYDFENEIEINNPAYLNVPAAMGFVGNLINKKITASGVASAEEDWGTAKLLKAQFDWVTTNLDNQDMINHFLNQYISSIVDYSGTTGIEDQVALFYEKSTDEEAITALKEKEEMWAPLAKGEPAPAFTIPDINGDMVSLSDFKGKYVYIDFWATWCGPCKVEIPILEEMAVTYADKNIEIISISVDQDKQAWIDMVTEDNPQWLQLHDGINMNDDYLVKYIPTFVLIDRDGNFINSRAPRPSSGEKLESLLNSLEGI